MASGNVTASGLYIPHQLDKNATNAPSAIDIHRDLHSSSVR